MKTVSFAVVSQSKQFLSLKAVQKITSDYIVDDDTSTMA